MIQAIKILFKIWLCLVLTVIVGISTNYLIPMAINISNDTLSCLIISIIIPLATIFVCGISYYTAVSVMRDVEKALQKLE